MKYISRYIEKGVLEDLTQKMVFISGPRQSGKTTLAKQILKRMNCSISRCYLNWDSAKDREMIIREEFPAGQKMLALNEIHKYKRWRQVVKGLYDKRSDELKILVTGSGKLDYYRHGGDSLQGRYHFYRLHPLSLYEITPSNQKNLKKLLRFGGFPEPFGLNSDRETKRWSREYRTRIINEDLSTLENVKDISLIEHLSIRLPDLVGSPLSLNALRLDLQVAHETVQRWLAILENLYVIFRLYPFGAPNIRAVKKEAKHYHFDWTLIEEEGIRFENFIACSLLKYCHYKQDYDGENMELRFFRDIDRREVDFVILKNNQPEYFIECKFKSKEVNPALLYLKQRFQNAQSVQISFHPQEAYITRNGIRVCSAVDFLHELGV